MKIKVTRNLESYKKNRQVESCKKESVGQDVAEYQKWVDYDMKRYGRISNDTLKKVRAAGLSVVKDQYGDYEVIAYRKDESCKDESCKKDEAKEPARKLRIRELPRAKKEIRKSFGDDISPDEI